MTDNNGKDANEISADKGESVVHIDKNGAEELKKIKNKLELSWAKLSLAVAMVVA